MEQEQKRPRPSDYAERQKKKTIEMYARVEAPVTSGEARAKAVDDYKIQQLFATRLSVLIVNTGIRHAELARKTGINQATLSLIANRKMKPTVKHIVKLSLFFGCSADYLLGLAPREKIKEVEK